MYKVVIYKIVNFSVFAVWKKGRKIDLYLTEKLDKVEKSFINKQLTLNHKQYYCS